MKTHVQIRSLTRRPLALALTILLAPAALAGDLPTGFDLKSGAVDVPATLGQTMTLKQHSKGAIIQWGAFNIGEGYHVDFQQPGSDSVTLNRVMGGSASEINGLLSANGRVFVVNPNGILFGSTSQINVGGLVASTLGITDGAFTSGVANGKFFFSQPSGGGGGSTGVQNGGTITIHTAGGMADLLSGSSVLNTGTIQADGGSIGLGWGGQILLDVGGDGLTTLVINPAGDGAGVADLSNSGHLQADGGLVEIRSGLGDVTGVIKQSGTIRARSLQNRGGRIVLDSGRNPLNISGSHDTSSTTQGVAGGSIDITSHQTMRVQSTTYFNAGGGNGGANGTLTLASDASMLVLGRDLYDVENGNLDLVHYSLLVDAPLGDALSRNTDVVLKAQGAPSRQDISGAFDGSVWFMNGGSALGSDGIFHGRPDASINKSDGGNSALTVSANRNIIMQKGSAIKASSGALNVDFNSDSQGTTAGSAQDFGGGNLETGGTIEMLTASIETHGGNVRFYGQGDPVNGRARGSNSVEDPVDLMRSNPVTGVNLFLSSINTCVIAGATCTGAGTISLRGQGFTSPTATTYDRPGTGVVMQGSHLLSGNGDILLDGLGGIGGTGVHVADRVVEGLPAYRSILLTQTGAIRLTGVTPDQAASDNTLLQDAGSGVIVDYGSMLTAGTDIVVTGRGGDLSGSLLGHQKLDDRFDPSDGVIIRGATLQAGPRQAINIIGSAGSVGTDTGAVTLPVAAVRISQAAERLNNPLRQSALSVLGGVIDIKGTGDVYLDNSLLGAQSIDGVAGAIRLTADNVLFGAGSLLDVNGAADAGSVLVQTAGVTAMDAAAAIRANSSHNGNGGSIVLYGASGLHAYGALSARGGDTGGNGGAIETSGGGIDLKGLRVDASASNGAAGTWLIDPYDVTIGSGAGPGAVPLNPFVPFATSTVRDGEINFALNNGSDVTITTGTGGAGAGNITINSGVNILRSTGTAPVTFRLDANGSISGNYFSVESTAGAMNIVFDVDANGVAPYQGIRFFGAQLKTNGGDIAMFGQNDPLNGYATDIINGIYLDTSLLDTRVGQNDANGGGSVSLRGSGGYYGGGSGVTLSDSDIHTATGDIDVVGLGRGGGSGVSMSANVFSGGATLSTTSGHLAVTGFGTTSGIGGTHTHGISATAYLLQTDAGNVDLRGHGSADNGTNFSDGIKLDSRTQINSNSGVIALSGSSDGSGTGVSMVSTYIDSLTGLPYAAPEIDSGSGTIIERAHNNGSTDALLLGGTLTSTGTVNLRPGGVDANGNLVEYAGDAIALGGALGFGLDATELNRISASQLVLGSDIQQGGISVSAALVYGHDLTLQSGAGGGIAVNAAIDVGTHTLGLISAGAITQTAPITAASLLVLSSGASVILANAGNQISSSTLAGSAAGNFTLVNAGTVGIGNVNATGFAAGVNAPQPLSASGVTGTDLLVRAITGDMLLNANVSGNRVDLVSAGLINNNGGYTIMAANGWRVWGNTWVGETRGGLAGSGNLPNLYGCSFGSGCGSVVVVPNAGNHFLYALQPTATINMADSSREYGLANGLFNYGIAGMILGDNAAQAITGSATTTATQASNVGSYAIGGSFASPAGYLTNVIPGALTVTPATLAYIANPYSRLYGDANPAFNGIVSGFRLTDTQANASSGKLVFNTSATQASNIGTYAINGGGLSAVNYVFVQGAGNASALGITPATLTYVANPYSRVYGDSNPVLDGTVSGFRLADTQANATSGNLVFATSATPASNIGTYTVDGSGLIAENYVFVQAAGNSVAMDITAATLTYVANPRQRAVGVANGMFDGSVSGFRNGDTLSASTNGTLTFGTPANTNSPTGLYAISGSGLSASNYIFTQASGNAVALTITPPRGTYTLDFVRETPVTYVYDRNFGIVGLCPATDLAAASRDKDGDTLAREWSRVRSRPNLANCVSTRQENSCGDF